MYYIEDDTEDRETDCDEFRGLDALLMPNFTGNMDLIRCGLASSGKGCLGILAYSKPSGMLGTGDLSHHTPKFVL